MSSELLADLPADRGYALVGPHVAVVGRGVAQRFCPSDPSRRFVQAAKWVADNLGPDDVAFLSFTFDPAEPGSEIVRCDQVAEIHVNGTVADPVLRPPAELVSDDPSPFKSMVRQAVDRLGDPGLNKVVLSRVIDLPAAGVTVPMLASALHEAFPMCLTYVHNNFVGASPELLLRRRGNDVTSLVLAGSAPVSQAEGLLESQKDLTEHFIARDSVATALEDYAEQVSVDPEPFILRLPNVAHLASYVRATVDSDVPTLEILDAVHPTAAVCGTPRMTALEVIRELESEPRHTFAGPTGIIRGNGDADIALALRCVRLEAEGIARAHVGCGIMPDSDPELEARETLLKVAAVANVIADLRMD